MGVRREILAVIPARAGSKGIPGKNKRIVGGKPLVCWSIEAALASKSITRVVVSTDDPDIFSIAASYGVSPLWRPAELATDEARTDDVLIHALNQHNVNPQPLEAVVLLQPTVPVRRVGLVDDVIRRWEVTAADCAMTAHRLHFVWQKRPFWPKAAEGRDIIDGANPDNWDYKWMSQSNRRPTRQAMLPEEERWHEDGSVYVVDAQFLLRTRSRVGGRMEIVETEQTVDIDTERDLAVAEALLRATPPYAPAFVWRPYEVGGWIVTSPNKTNGLPAPPVNLDPVMPRIDWTLPPSVTADMAVA